MKRGAVSSLSPKEQVCSLWQPCAIGRKPGRGGNSMYPRQTLYFCCNATYREYMLRDGLSLGVGNFFTPFLTQPCCLVTYQHSLMAIFFFSLTRPYAHILSVPVSETMASYSGQTQYQALQQSQTYAVYPQTTQAYGLPPFGKPEFLQ